MEKIILVGHGSPKKDANQMEIVGGMLHEHLHPGCTEKCISTSYLQFEPPTLEETLESTLKTGPERVIIHPYFLSPGMHVTSDIPEVIKDAQSRYPDTRIIYTEPLGISEKIVSVIKERINAACGIKPSEIESESFRILSEESDFKHIPEELRPIVKRVVHTTADFDFINSMIFHPKALEAGLRAIKSGRKVLTDVEMIRSGINKRMLSSWNGEVICKINDVEPNDSRTRSEAAIGEALDDSVGIVAIGNAPTALIKCIELINEGKALPDLVIGVPVGFVRAVESKAMLAVQKFPFITNSGRKGGSTIAAAIVNALLKIAGGNA
jgi:precorrin-8X/cobalt-precorrin-8 methylmutase